MRPTPDDLLIAAEWLGCMDGEDAEAAERVAKWLYQQAETQEIRKIAREHGVSVRALRSMLRRRKAVQS